MEVQIWQIWSNCHLGKLWRLWRTQGNSFHVSARRFVENGIGLEWLKPLIVITTPIASASVSIPFWFTTVKKSCSSITGKRILYKTSPRASRILSFEAWNNNRCCEAFLQQEKKIKMRTSWQQMWNSCWWNNSTSCLSVCWLTKYLFVFTFALSLSPGNTGFAQINFLDVQGLSLHNARDSSQSDFGESLGLQRKRRLHINEFQTLLFQVILGHSRCLKQRKVHSFFRTKNIISFHLSSKRINFRYCKRGC